MKKNLCFTLLCALSINAFATDIGTIDVVSSTIDFREADATEVSTVNIIGSEQIEEINARQINEILQTVPGVTADVRPGEVVEIHMRGVNQQEFMWEDTGVAVIIDGVPIYQQKSGKFRLNMSDIKSIKVIKGSASYLYGNNATAGAVIITTSRPKGDKNKITVNAESGSHNYKDLTGELMYSTDNYAVNINLNKRSTDGYWIDSELWSKSFGGKFSYYIDNTSDVTFGIDKTQKYEQANRAGVTGVTEAEYMPEGNGRNSYQKDNEVDLDKYFLKYNKDFGSNANLLVNVYNYLDNYEYISSPQDTNNDGSNDTYSTHSQKESKQNGLKLEFKQSIDKFAYLIGYENRNIDYKNASDKLITLDNADVNITAGETSFTKDEQNINAFYTELKYMFSDDFTGTFNVRYDHQKEHYEDVSLDYDGTWNTILTQKDKTFKNTAFRLGGVYDVSSSNAIFSNISTGYRTPTLDKILDNDIYQADLSNTHYISDLKTQRSISFDIGNRGKISMLNYEASIFYIKTKDIIGREYGTYSDGQTQNVGDSENTGLELSLKSDLNDKLSFSLAYTYLRSRYTKHNPFHLKIYDSAFASHYDTYNIVGNELPRTPNHKADLYIKYKLTPQWKIISELYAQSNYYADETNMVKAPAYAYVNLQTRYTLKLGEHNLEFYAKVNNLFDKQYYQTVFGMYDRNKDGVFNEEDSTITVNPGREFYAGLKYSF